jgi:hypothetical protein
MSHGTAIVTETLFGLLEMPTDNVEKGLDT